MLWIDACSAGEIGAEEAKRFDHGERTFAIFRNDRHEYFCTDGLCTHENVHQADGLVMENTIECPKHSSIFDFTKVRSRHRLLAQISSPIQPRSRTAAS